METDGVVSDSNGAGDSVDSVAASAASNALIFLLRSSRMVSSSDWTSHPPSPGATAADDVDVVDDIDGDTAAPGLPMPLTVELCCS